MPIFTRRQLQQMLTELGPWLCIGKAVDLQKRLEHCSPDQAIPAEFELALSWAVAKTAHLEIERPVGNRRPDIYSSNLLPSAPVSVDVRAISDAALSGQAAMRRAAKIINQTCDRIVEGASIYLHYAFLESSGYVRDSYGRARFERHRKINMSFQMEPGLRASLAAWLSSGRTNKPLRLTSPDIDVVITWRDNVHSGQNTFCTMPSLAYDPRDNPLYRGMESKADQLGDAPEGVHRGIFVGDAGCELLINIGRSDRDNHMYSGQQVIETFLADTNIDFVAVFSVRRSKRWPLESSEKPYTWQLYLFEQKKTTEKLDLSRLQHLQRLLPAPYLIGSEARSWHEQGMFSPQARGRYLQTTMSMGGPLMSVRISARALQELMAGRLTAEEFTNAIA